MSTDPIRKVIDQFLFRRKRQEFGRTGFGRDVQPSKKIKNVDPGATGDRHQSKNGKYRASHNNGLQTRDVHLVSVISGRCHWIFIRRPNYFEVFGTQVASQGYYPFYTNVRPRTFLWTQSASLDNATFPRSRCGHALQPIF